MKIAAISAAVLVCLVLACTALLPERYAVNAPFRGTFFGAEPLPPSALQNRVSLPDGFSIDVYATGIRNARFLRFTETGDLLVSSPREGKVFLLERDADGDGRADGLHTLMEGLDRPHGLDFHEGWLYVAESPGVKRVRYDASKRATSGEVEQVVSGLPEGGNHFTRTVRFGPDGLMYVSIGSSCNVCEEEDELRATVARYRPDGSAAEIYASGLRNAVGLDWRTGTSELYATDNGRDLLGDDFPPCELNKV